MPRKKAGISSHAFRVRYLRRSREIYRRFLETKPWIKQMHSTFLGLKPGMKIVDVGCGTGDFTRYLASLVPGKRAIIGVDIRAANIRTAEKQTKKEGMAGKITFRKGDTYVDGVRKLEGKFFDIGNRLPTIVHKAGLREIKAEVQADTYLTSDPRRRLEDVRDELGFNLANFKETRKLDAKAMLAGGASKRKIDQYNRWFVKWMKGMLDDNEKLRNDTVFSTGGIVLVAGRK